MSLKSQIIGVTLFSRLDSLSLITSYIYLSFLSAFEPMAQSMLESEPINPEPGTVTMHSLCLQKLKTKNTINSIYADLRRITK
jgi:hypothetical protein